MSDTASPTEDQVPEMVARMARAAFEQMVIGLGLADREWFHEWENQHPRVRADWYACIRAALEVAREPTGAMKDAGAATYGVHELHIGPLPQSTIDGQPSKAWRAMIAAALG